MYGRPCTWADQMSLVNIEVSNQEERKSIEFIANYGHVQDRLSIRDGSVLSMQCGPSGQDTLLGPNTICRSIADLSARRHELLGANETSQAQVILFRNCFLQVHV